MKRNFVKPLDWGDFVLQTSTMGSAPRRHLVIPDLPPVGSTNFTTLSAPLPLSLYTDRLPVLIKLTAVDVSVGSAGPHNISHIAINYVARSLNIAILRHCTYVRHCIPRRPIELRRRMQLITMRVYTQYCDVKKNTNQYSILTPLQAHVRVRAVRISSIAIPTKYTKLKAAIRYAVRAALRFDAANAVN